MAHKKQVPMLRRNLLSILIYVCVQRKCWLRFGCWLFVVASLAKAA